MLPTMQIKKLFPSIFYIVLLLNLTLNQNAFSATWKIISKNEIVEYSFDQESIVGTAKNKEISIKVNILKDPKEGDKSRLLRFLISCSNSTLLLDEIKRYSEYELKGIETVFKGNTTETIPKPNTVGQRYIDIACGDGLNQNEKKWTEVRSGVADDGRKFTVYYGDITGNNSIRKLTQITNFINPNQTLSSMKLEMLLNCNIKKLFYISNFSYDQHWAMGNGVSKKVSQNGFSFSSDREEQKISCSHNLKVVDNNVNKEWDALATNYNNNLQKEDDEKAKQDAIDAKNEIRFKSCDDEFYARSIEKVTNKYNGQVTTRKKFATQFFPAQNGYKPIPKFGEHIPLIWHITLLDQNGTRIGDSTMMYCVTDKNSSKVIGVEPYSR